MCQAASILDTKDIAVNRLVKELCSQEAYLLVAKTDNKYVPCTLMIHATKRNKEGLWIGEMGYSAYSAWLGLSDTMPFEHKPEGTELCVYMGRAF